MKGIRYRCPCDADVIRLQIFRVIDTWGDMVRAAIRVPETGAFAGNFIYPESEFHETSEEALRDAVGRLTRRLERAKALLEQEKVA